MIEFETLEIKNFMSIGQANLVLNKGGFTLISAENHRVEDAAQSNGSGKSTISESMVWALTGETIRGHKEVINRYTEGDCEVKLTFSFNGHKWAVKRSIARDKEKTLVIVKDGLILEAKGYRDACGVLERELPELSFKFINSVIILGQGLPGRFTNNSPAGRKAVLEELTNADFMINQIKENIARRKSDLEVSLRGSEDKLLSLTTTKENAQREIETGRQTLDELNKFDLNTEKEALEDLAIKGKEQNSKVQELSEKVGYARDQVTQDRLAKSQVSTNYEEVINGLQKKASLEKEAKRMAIEKEISEKLSKLREEKMAAEVAVNDKYKDLIIKATKESYEKLLELKEEKTKIQSELGTVSLTISGGRCPTCGQIMPGVTSEQIEEAKVNKEKLELRLEEVKRQIFRLEATISSTESTLTESKSAEWKAISVEYIEKTDVVSREKDQRFLELSKIDEDLKLEVDKILEKSTKEVEELDNKLKESQTRLSELNFRANQANAELEQLREDYRSKKSKIEAYLAKAELVREQIRVAQDKLSGLDKDIGETESQKAVWLARLDIVNKMATFASRDFRGILLETVIARLDQILKGYSQLVYGNQLTNFYQSGNAIVVEFDGKEYESLSGGEQQKINVLLQLSLRDLIIELTGVTGSFILLDEVFDGLDYYGCEKMVDLFQSLETSVFIITHHENLDIPYDYEIRVIKEPDGVAHLQVV